MRRQNSPGKISGLPFIVQITSPVCTAIPSISYVYTIIAPYSLYGHLPVSFHQKIHLVSNIDQFTALDLLTSPGEPGLECTRFQFVAVFQRALEEMQNELQKV